MNDGCVITLPLASEAKTMSEHSDLLHEEKSRIQKAIEAAIRYGLRSSTIKLEHNCNSEIIKKLVKWVEAFGYMVRVLWDWPGDNYCYILIHW